MIFFSKKFACLEMGVIFCFTTILLILLSVSPDQTYWIANVFHDKTFLYIWLPIYLIGNYVIDNSVSIVQMTRMKTRRDAMGFLMIQQFLHALFCVTIWFVVITILSIVKFNGISVMRITEVLNWCLKYMGEIILISNAIIILRRSNKKQLREFAYVITYCLVLIENTLVSEFNMVSPRNMYVCFSWMFSDYYFAFVVLLLLDILTVNIVLLKSAKEDVL